MATAVTAVATGATAAVIAATVIPEALDDGHPAIEPVVVRPPRS
ncbi:hypothetical protein [Streptomyces sp. NPDC000229]